MSVNADCMARCLIVIHMWTWDTFFFKDEEVWPNIFAQINYMMVCDLRCA